VNNKEREMSKQITLTITVTEKMLKTAIKATGLKIVDKEQFAQMFTDEKFTKAMTEDMLNVWLQANEDDYGDGLAMLFGDCVEYAE